MAGRRQAGAASVEYVVVSVVVIGVLFAPLFDGRSLVELVLASLRGFQANSTFLLSMP